MKTFLAEARKAVAALAAGLVAATAAGVVSHSTSVLVGGWLTAAGAALATYARKPNAAKYVPEHEETT